MFFEQIVFLIVWLGCGLITCIFVAFHTKRAREDIVAFPFILSMGTLGLIIYAVARLVIFLARSNEEDK